MWPHKAALNSSHIFLVHFSSVQFSCSVMSDSLWPHELQHARAPCPSPTSGVYSNSCSSSWWCHPTISSSVVPFSSCPQSLPSSGSFPMSQLFAWGGQSTGISASMEQTLGSPMDCKEIQPVYPKGDQSWVFIGKTNVEAETPVLWPLYVKSWLIWKDPDAGKDWGQEEKGTTEDGITDSIDMSLSKL